MLKNKKENQINENINETLIKKLITKPIAELDYQIAEINIFQEDHNTFVQVIIDHEKGVTLDDCVKVTEKINPILDKEEELEDKSYILDVASKGVEK